MTDQAPQQTLPPPQPPAAPPCTPPMVMYPKKSSLLGKFMQTIFIMTFLGSLALNIVMICVVYAMYRDTTFESSVIDDGKADEEVAVYTIQGTIDSQQAALFDKFYRKVRDEKNIKAVVIRVESPGGGVSASDCIMAKVKAIREKLGRPVVISMGSVAASGGYYVSVPANAIYAEPNTMTGSIGVLAVWPILKDFLDQHGVDVRIVRSTQAKLWKARSFNPFEKPDKYVSEDIIDGLTRMHEMFEQVVKDGRGEKLKITTTDVTMTDENGQSVTVQDTAPFNGRVYIAEDAIQLGLVDKIGYMDDAVEAAASLAGLSRPKVVQYTRRIPLSEQVGLAGARPIIDKELVEDLMTPQIMMIWKAE